MSTLYRPVKIVSAEQAEALPLSTRAIRPDGQAAARLDGVSEGGQWTSKLRLYAHDEVIGWTALVPIEAEERWQDGSKTVWNLGEGEATAADVDDYERRNGSRPLRRLVTPWTEV